MGYEEGFSDGKSDPLLENTKHFVLYLSSGPQPFWVSCQILSHADHVSPKEVLELHATLTLKSKVVKFFDSLFTAGQLDISKYQEEDIEILAVWERPNKLSFISKWYR